MKTKSQKLRKNLALKIAIIESHKTQRVVAQRAGIPEVRLSGIVSGRFEATDDERKALGRVLKRSLETLFETPTEAVAS